MHQAFIGHVGKVLHPEHRDLLRFDWLQTLQLTRSLSSEQVYSNRIVHTRARTVWTFPLESTFSELQFSWRTGRERGFRCRVPAAKWIYLHIVVAVSNPLGPGCAAVRVREWHQTRHFTYITAVDARSLTVEECKRRTTVPCPAPILWPVCVSLNNAVPHKDLWYFICNLSKYGPILITFAEIL